MRILLIGAGGVGDAIAKIAARRDFFDTLVVSDYDESRAQRTVDWIRARHGDDVAARFGTAQIDASDPEVVAAVARAHGATHVMNAVEPKFVPSVFAGALAADADYLDMAMSLSEPHPTDPYAETGVKLGDDQFAQAGDWERAGRLALVGMGVEPGLSDVLARYAVDHLFASVDELGVRDGANLVVRDEHGEEIFAPSFSIWTTIEECLNPPVVWERERGWYTTAPFSEPEVFDFPEGIGPIECVNVEHEEVLLMPRWLDAQRVTFKYGLGDEFIGVLKTLHTLGLDRTTPLRVRSANGPVEVAPRDVVAAALPDPATIGPRMTGKTCAGVWVTGTDAKSGDRRETYLYHVADNEWTMAEYDSQCVVWQTALNPVIALELLAKGQWSGVGVLGPEAFDAAVFLDLMGAPEDFGGYGQPFRFDDRVGGFAAAAAASEATGAGGGSGS
jgi:saccharopine dehydrogenase-like NADP-dependent oxidoreductase